MSEKNHKPGLGDGETVTRRHVATRRDELRKRKEKRMEEKRGHTLGGENLVLDQISKLPKDLKGPQDVSQLLHILKMDGIEAYYNVSELNPEVIKGPWIFPEGDPKIAQLIYIACNSQDVSLLRNVTFCLIIISAHPETMTWCFQLEPFVPAAIQLLQHCPDAQVKENVYWILSNMCFDNSHSRNFIVYSGIADAMLSVNDDDWRMIHNISSVFRSLLKFHPLPDRESIIKPLWNKLIRRLYEEPPKQMQNELRGAVQLLLCSPAHSWKEAIVQDEQFWSYITQHEEWFEHAVLLTQSFEVHSLLLRRGALDFYIGLLSHANPRIRAQGGLALSNLAESGICLPALCNDKVFTALQLQIYNSDVFQVLKQIYWIVVCLIRTARQTNQHKSFYPLMIEHHFVKYLCSAIQVPEPLLQENAVEAISFLTGYNRRLVMQQLEEYEGDQYLEHTLFMHPNPKIQQLVEIILQ